MTDAIDDTRAVIWQEKSQYWLVTLIKPRSHLLIVGGGVDARPLVVLAKELGWEVTLSDSRPVNARREYFMSVDTILRCSVSALMSEPLVSYCDAAVVMTHNLKMDADAIQVLQASNIRYLALLGPVSRKNRVLKFAGLREEDLIVPVAGPAGLHLGAELPEGIALSILAECHAVLQQADAHSLNGRFT